MGFGFKRCVGQLPTGASNNMSVEPTTLSQGLVEITPHLELLVKHTLAASISLMAGLSLKPCVRLRQRL